MPRGDIAVEADFARIEQVLGNLVDNAFRHTPRGGCIEVAATPTKSGVALRVVDNGEGIAPEDIPHVFDRFYRGAGETSGSGSGMGLAISREIVRAHGSELQVARRSGGGTSFTFTLPLVRVRYASNGSQTQQVTVRGARDPVADG